MFNFVVTSFLQKRQLDASGSGGSAKTWFLGSPGELKVLVEQNFKHRRPGDGDPKHVVMVPIPTDKVVFLDTQLRTGEEFKGIFSSRYPGELPRKQTLLNTEQDLESRKRSPKSCWVVVYSSDILSRDEKPNNELPPLLSVDNEPLNWELVSLVGSGSDEPVPIHPDTLCANYFGLDGGTPNGFSEAEFVNKLKKSVLYWQDRI